MQKMLIGIFVVMIICFSIIGLIRGEGKVQDLKETSESSVNFK
ncbi:hypothetical protein SFC66_02815 [Terribacillus saccharophilus]